VSPRRGEPGSAPRRRFFLARAPDPGPPELLAEDVDHAQRVLRLAPGDRLTGLDGRGGSWPLVVARSEPGRLALEVDGDPEHEHEPGGAGSDLPWIEVAVAWPKPPRAEEMLGRLVQLGAAAVTPLGTARSGPHARELSDARRERLARVLREACKQSGCAWLPELRAGADLGSVARGPGERLLLDPGAGTSLSSWIHERAPRSPWPWTREQPLVLVVGPEGGLDPGEAAALAEAGEHGGARALCLGPRILRIETAAEAALAVLSAACFMPRRS